MLNGHWQRVCPPIDPKARNRAGMSCERLAVSVCELFIDVLVPPAEQFMYTISKEPGMIKMQVPKALLRPRPGRWWGTT